MEQKCLKHLKTSKVAFSGEMSQIWNQKQLKVPKTAQNFFTWWNEPFSLQMAKSALKRIKTAQNTKSVIFWWNWAISSKKCLKHLKTAQNIKSFISSVMRHMISKQKHQRNQKQLKVPKKT